MTGTNGCPRLRLGRFEAVEAESTTGALFLTVCFFFPPIFGVGGVRRLRFITLIIVCYVDPFVRQDDYNQGTTNTNCRQRDLQNGDATPMSSEA